MMKNLFNILAMSLFFLTLSSPAATNESKMTHQGLQKQTLTDALELAQQQLSVFSLTKRLAFTREKVDRDGEIESYRYTPNGLDTGRWAKLDTHYSTNRHETKVWENDVLFQPETFMVDEVEIVQETETKVVFAMPISLSLTVDSEAVEAPKMDHYTFRAELELDKKNNHLTSVKIFAIKAFSPQFGVTVEEYQSLSTLAELYEDGPIVITKQIEKVRGDFGFFVSIDEDTEITNLDFVTVPLEQIPN
jgi:hypothetical protein